MATSESEQEGIGPRLRGATLEFYYFLRSSLWRAIALFGIFLVVVGFLFDLLNLHAVFAGMFGLWGISTILAAILGYVGFQAIRLYGRYVDQPY